jgi:hypothetical protein
MYKELDYNNPRTKKKILARSKIAKLGGPLGPV